MEEVTKRWETLSLTEIEGVEHDFSTTDMVKGPALIAKFFTKRRVNLVAVAKTLNRAWRMEKNFEIRDVGDNKAIILFEEEVDLQRVLMNSPWSFDKYLLALHKLGEDEHIQGIRFDDVSFWVQIHDLLARRMTKETWVRIGSTLGEVDQVDVPATRILLGKCIRVRVKIDITKPLCRGRLVKFRGSNSCWVLFHYE